VCKASHALRDLARRVESKGVSPSPGQQQILDVGKADPLLRNYRDVAERLGRSRESVKNAILQLRRKL
jgi:hypothetical protein